MVSKAEQLAKLLPNVLHTEVFQARLASLVGKYVGIGMYSRTMEESKYSRPLLVCGVLEEWQSMYRVVGEGGASHAYFGADEAFCIDFNGAAATVKHDKDEEGEWQLLGFEKLTLILLMSDFVPWKKKHES